MKPEKDLEVTWFFADKLFRWMEFTTIISAIYYFKQKIGGGYLHFLFFICLVPLVMVLLTFPKIITETLFPNIKQKWLKHTSWFISVVIVILYSILIFKAVMQITEHSF